MRSTLCRLIIGMSVIVASPPAATAQSGRISGTVHDATGAVLPGATVSARNESTGLIRTEVTDASGGYRLLALPPPGPYQVTVEIQGFRSETRQLVLNIDQTVTVDFALKPANVAETVTVTGESPVVDTTRSDVGTSLTTTQIQALPVAARRWIDMAMLTPGSSQDQIRGQYYRGTVGIGAGVTNFFSTGNVVDGVNNTWTQQGEGRQNFPMDAIQEFKVSTSSHTAENGLATGGIVNVVTKSGTNEVQAGAFLFYRNQAMTARQAFQTFNPPYSRYQIGGTAGGPVVVNKLHYFFTYERTDENVYNTVSTPAWPQYSGTYLSEQYRWTYLGRGDLQISQNQSLFARFGQEYDYRPELTTGGSTVPSASLDFSVPRTALVLGHTWIINQRALNDFRFQYAYAKYEVTPPGSHGGWDPGYFGDDRLSRCTPIFLYPSLSVGGCGTSQLGPEYRIQIKDDYTHQATYAGRHQWKTGFDFSAVRYDQDSMINPRGTWTFPLDRPYDASNPATWPTQYTESLPSYAKLPSLYYGLYIQDTWQPVRSLTVNLGLRYDRQIGAYGDYLEKHLALTAEKLGPEAGRFPIAVPFIDTSIRGDKDNFGPRVGFAWDPFDDGRTNIHAAWGLYRDNMRVYPLQAEITWPQAQTITIPRPSFPDPLQGQSRNAFLSTAPPNITINANDLESPYAHSAAVGATRELTPDLGVTADFIYVNRFADASNVDINLPDAATRQRPHPQFGRVSVYSSVGSTTYRALLVKVDKHLSNRWSALVSYTLAYAREIAFSNAQGDRYGYAELKGYSPADRRHVLRVSGTLQLPWDTQFSAILDLRSSQPFNPATSLDINGDTYTGDLPPGVAFRSGCRDLSFDAINARRAASGLPAVNSVACPGYQDLDIRVSKSITFRSHRIELLGQLFNVTNRANFATPVSNPLSATFGQVNQIVPYLNAPSRLAELAVRFHF
jgi:hypothetical protein